MTDSQSTESADRPCRIVGPYLPVGDTDWECRTHGVLAELRDTSKVGGVVRRGDFFCPVGMDLPPGRQS